MNRLAALALAAVLVAGCYVPSPKTAKTRTLSKQVELGDADKVELTVSMGVGEMTLAGGATQLLDASFEYNIPSWKPEVEYQVEGRTGRLDVSQPPSVLAAALPKDVRYVWDLKVNEDVPVYLDLDLGAGKSHVDLSNVNLTGYDIDVGVGELFIDLSGPRQQSLDAEIEGGIGKLEMILPVEVGVRVVVSGGLGKISAIGLQQADEGHVFVNQAWGKTDVRLDLDIEGGIGEVVLKTAASTI
ncbi:MAG: hypothetical protein JSU73_12055 [candidate division WOR-3 bacterium]|nr:MAG: hypothetical protein JSU73_12055 [candidate division WOR-3 bacterium]